MVHGLLMALTLDWTPDYHLAGCHFSWALQLMAQLQQQQHDVSVVS